MAMNFPLHVAQAFFPAKLHRFMGIATSTAYGKARWMNRKEKALFLSSRHTGIALSPSLRLAEDDSFKNLALVAPSGSGKTTRFVIPNLLNLTGSAVVTDPSGEIYRATSGHLARRGFQVQVLQPAEVGKSLRFNPLTCFRTPQELRRLATVLCQAVGGKEPFWTIGAVDILTLILQALTGVGGEDAPAAPSSSSAYQDLANARWVLNHIGVEKEAVTGFMSGRLDEVAFMEFRAFLAQDHKVVSSHLSTARAALELFSDPEVARLTSGNTVDIAALREKPTVIYLIVPEHKIKYFSVILNLFYSACFEHCLTHWDERDATKNNHLLPVYFFLDEFGNLGKINDFAQVITTLRKRRCPVSLVLQEKSQLDAIYDRKDAQTIFSGGCGNKLFFSGLDQESCGYLESVLGQITEYDTYFAGVSERAKLIGKPLMRADEIRMLPDGKAILVSGNKRPVLFDMPPFFRVDELLRKSREEPFSFPRQGEGGKPAYLPIVQHEQPELPGMATDGREYRFFMGKDN